MSDGTRWIFIFLAGVWGGMLTAVIVLPAQAPLQQRDFLGVFLLASFACATALVSIAPWKGEP